MAGMRRILATGWCMHLPDTDVSGALAGFLGRPVGAWAAEPAPAPGKASVLLGRKGLLAKDPATRLALCAVHRALGLPAGRPQWALSTSTAVVACSNLGNVETVAAVSRTAAAEGGRAVSILDAPNVSSNVVASTVALWFGFGGPNLMVCSGSTAGLDGLRLAETLLLSRRAARVVLVGTEAGDEIAADLYRSGGTGRELRAGAACVVLEAAPTAINNGRRVPPQRATVEVASETGGDLRRYVPAVTIGTAGFDPAAQWGDCYGAEGVVGLALAAHLVADEGFGLVGVSSEDDDGSRSALVTAAESGSAGGTRE
jgi:3-oxoacyl-[acyl-carrier-protein] synthase II